MYVENSCIFRTQQSCKLGRNLISYNTIMNNSLINLEFSNISAFKLLLFSFRLIKLRRSISYESRYCRGLCGKVVVIRILYEICAQKLLKNTREVFENRLASLNLMSGIRYTFRTDNVKTKNSQNLCLFNVFEFKHPI